MYNETSMLSLRHIYTQVLVYDFNLWLEERTLYK